ncbi:MAG: hypothetical protein EA374_05710 [Acholeplasmatales bacterium]|nr:MAG: hypothetical protein EA374_05710 [Acholeplasmatales bacterium]
MVMNQTEIHEAWRKGTVIRFRYGQRLATAKFYAGRVVQLFPSQDKVRLVLCDLKTVKPLIDDVGASQTFTFSLTAMHDVESMPWLTWPMASIEASPVEPMPAKTCEAAWFAPLYAKSRYQTVDALKPLSLLDGKAARCHVYRNRLSVIVLGVTQPIYSEVLRYDLVEGTWQVSGTMLHAEQPLYRYFKRLPTRDAHPEDAVTFLKQHARTDIECDDTARWLIEHRNIPARDHDRLKTLFDAGEGNRPFATFSGLRNTWQRGRRAVLLPVLPNRFNLRVMHAVHEGFKGPVTLVKSSLDLLAKDMVDLFVLTALMSDTRVLVIDGSAGLDLTPWPGIMRLGQAETIIADLDVPAHRHNRDACPLTELPEDVFTALETGDLWAREVAALQAYEHHALSRGLFHESIRLQTRLSEAYQRVPVVPVSSWLDTDFTAQDWFDTLCKSARRRHMKRARHGYGPLTEVFEAVREGNVTPLLKSLRDPAFFHKFKHIFPVLIVRHSGILPYVRHAFDHVVMIDPAPTALTDLLYANCLTVVETASPRYRHPAKTGLPGYHAEHYGDLFGVLKHQSSNGVKVLSRERTLCEVPVRVHRVANETESDPHLAKQEVKQLLHVFKTHPQPGVLRTPFNVQRQALKANLGHAVETLYHPVIGQPLWISWVIHPAMPQKTYDWLKNNPHILRTLALAESIESWIDLDALDRLSDGQDGIYHHVHQGVHPDTTLYRLPPLTHVFKTLFTEDFDMWMARDVLLQQIKGFEPFGSWQARYVFSDASKKVRLMVLVDEETRPYEALLTLQAKAKAHGVTVLILSPAQQALFNEHVLWMQPLGWLKAEQQVSG